jgi:hypothetical protein
MNLPHALAIHGLQVLPVLGWVLLFTRWDESRRKVLVLWAAAGSAAIIGASIAQAADGRAPLDPSVATGTLAVAGALTVTVTYVVAVVGLFGNRIEIAAAQVDRIRGSPKCRSTPASKRSSATNRSPASVTTVRLDATYSAPSASCE